jgi:L-aspartate semialdehyde sulfurtransferase ferredoxin
MSPTKIVNLRLDYPRAQVTQPILYYLIQEFRLIPNIRRASIDSASGGWIILQLEGEPDNLRAGQEYLEQLGVRVTEQDDEPEWMHPDFDWVI